jgi:hypothetical protein
MRVIIGKKEILMDHVMCTLKREVGGVHVMPL